MSSDQLASWKDGAVKRAILDFVARVTHEGTTDYVPPGERFAVFQAGAEEAMAMAESNAWAVASIKNDWRTVFA